MKKTTLILSIILSFIILFTSCSNTDKNTDITTDPSSESESSFTEKTTDEQLPYWENKELGLYFDLGKYIPTKPHDEQTDLFPTMDVLFYGCRPNVENPNREIAVIYSSAEKTNYEKVIEKINTFSKINEDASEPATYEIAGRLCEVYKTGSGVIESDYFVFHDDKDILVFCSIHYPTDEKAIYDIINGFAKSK